MHSCCVVIPLYKKYSSLSRFEKMTLRNTLEILHEYACIGVCPSSLSVEEYRQNGLERFITFDDRFFKSVNGYNELMLSESFYKAFSEYEYMLIVQLDAYVFGNNLEYYLNLGYDYIGCLHYTPHTGKELINGNGGFCLRKISSFVEASRNILKDLGNKKDWEDILYSYWYKDKLNIAPYEVSLTFGWQQDPQLCYEENNKELPFGCHKPHIFGKDFEPYNKIIKR